MYRLIVFLEHAKRSIKHLVNEIKRPSEKWGSFIVIEKNHILFPERLCIPVSSEAHSRPVHVRIFAKKGFEFLFERVVRVNSVKQVYNHRKSVKQAIVGYCSIGYPCILRFSRE